MGLLSTFMLRGLTLLLALFGIPRAFSVHARPKGRDGHCLTGFQAARCAAAAKGRRDVVSCNFGIGGGAKAELAFAFIRRLLSGSGTFPRNALELRESDHFQAYSGFSLFVAGKARPFQAGDVVMEIPLESVLWRGTVERLDLLRTHAKPGGFLSDADSMILNMGVLSRLAAMEKHEVGVHAAKFILYSRALGCSAVPNSTVFWTLEQRNWLADTDAFGMTSHILARLSEIHSSAPMLLDLSDLKSAFAQFSTRHFRIWLGGSSLWPDQLETAMIPGIDFCRHEEGGLKPVYDPARRTVRLLAAAPLFPGDEITVDFGPRDITDMIVATGRFRVGHSAAVFMPLPLDSDSSGVKAKLLRQLHWPLEIRLGENDLEDMPLLRLAVMPSEEFSAWSVGALVSGAPLAVSRAFRTEVQAHAFLADQCGRKLSGISATVPGEQVSTRDDIDRLHASSQYRRFLALVYGRCQNRSGAKLQRLKMWSLQNHPWTTIYVEEAMWRLDADGAYKECGRVCQGSLAADIPAHFDVTDLDQRLAFSTIVVLVNSKTREFVPYFRELLRANAVSVRGFVGARRRVRKILRLAVAFVKLKSPSCGRIDLSSFGWINELQGEAEVFTALRFLLVEVAILVKQFASLERIGNLPARR